MRRFSSLLGGILLFILFFMIGVATLHQLVGSGSRSGLLSRTAPQTPALPPQGSLVKVDLPPTQDRQDNAPSLPPSTDSPRQSRVPVAPVSQERAEESPSLVAILSLEDGLPLGSVKIYRDGEALWWQHNGFFKLLEPSRFQALLKDRYYTDLGPLSPEEARHYNLPPSTHVILVLAEQDSVRISSLLQEQKRPVHAPLIVTIRHSRKDGLSLVTGAPDSPDQKGGDR